MEYTLPFNVSEVAAHESTHNDQRTTGSPRRNGSNDRGKKDADEKVKATNDSGKSSARSRLHPRSRLNVGSHRRKSKDAAEHCRQSICGKGGTRLWKVSCFTVDKAKRRSQCQERSLLSRECIGQRRSCGVLELCVLLIRDFFCRVACFANHVPKCPENPRKGK